MPSISLRSISELLQADDVDRAISELESGISTDPSHTACHVLLATAYEQAGRTHDALLAWKSAYALCPDSPVVQKGVAGAARGLLSERASREDSGAAVSAEIVLKDGAPYQDLDDLIHELESARIVPDPTVEPANEESIDVDVEDVVSETLAKIYANQRFFVEAAEVYEKLSLQKPGRASEFAEKALEMRGRIAR